MIPNGFEYSQQKSEHHWVLAGIAILFSVLIHVVFIYFFSDWSFTGITNFAQKTKEWMMPDKVPPMRVQTLSADPMRIMDKVPGERDTPSRGPIEVSDKVEELRRDSSPALTAPPPIPREALSPGVPELSEISVANVDTTPWMPRQEIKQIFDRTVQDEVATLPRREIPMIERVSKAPDITPSVDLAGRKFGKAAEPPKPLKAAEVFDTEIVKGTFAKPQVPPPTVPDAAGKSVTKEKFADKPGDKRAVADSPESKTTAAKETSSPAAKETTTPNVGTPAATPEVTEKNGSEVLVEKVRETREKIAEIEERVEYKSLDKLLAVGLETYRDPDEPGQLYFRIGLQPRSDQQIKVLPKDIIWVQDVSASMTEERLRFCRNALISAMGAMNPGDRFNVIGFRDNFESCFPRWTEFTPESQKQAVDFISSMHSYGQTDVFGSLRALLHYERDPMRPMIAFVITDGMPTTGLTGTAKIIGSFAELNSGLMSVNMYGTTSSANQYLLDMLTYCNRGRSVILDGNRWDIPESMKLFYSSVRNPVLTDIAVTFDNASQSEVYPRRTTHLYQDQQLEIIGVCPAATPELILQVRGLAAGEGYDSVFRLNIEQHGKPGSPLIKAHWARQKMFHLVGKYTIKAHQQTLAEMLKVNQQYGVEIPYKVDQQ